MWGAVRYRHTFSYDDCNMVQSIAIDHKHPPSSYRTGTVMRRAMIYDATCHTLTPGAADKKYPPSVDKDYRNWINELMHTSGGHPEPVQQLVILRL